ncbi:MAG: hypothetical protein SFU98_12280 [Leptospiraceae bacterium]|nr:hypothetical protein [Leptospiraceae bacterium]
MRIITISISESEFLQFGFQSDSIPFKDLLDKISNELAKKALVRCQKIAKETGNTNDFKENQYENLKVVTPRQYWDEEFKE